MASGGSSLFLLLLFSKGVCKALSLPEFPNTDFYCFYWFLVPSPSFVTGFKVCLECFPCRILVHMLLLKVVPKWNVAVFQNSWTSSCTANTERGEINADLLACQLTRSMRILTAWLRIEVLWWQHKISFLKPELLVPIHLCLIKSAPTSCTPQH